VAASAARRNASTSRTTWSDGNTSSSGSPPSPASCSACSAAAAIAGAVLRPAGSSTIAGTGAPAWRSCSATRKRWSSPATTMGRACASGATRDHVACSIVSSPASGRNCFG